MHNFRAFECRVCRHQVLGLIPTLDFLDSVAYIIHHESLRSKRSGLEPPKTAQRYVSHKSSGSGKVWISLLVVSGMVTDSQAVACVDVNGNASCTHVLGINVMCVCGVCARMGLVRVYGMIGRAFATIVWFDECVPCTMVQQTVYGSQQQTANKSKCDVCVRESVVVIVFSHTPLYWLDILIFQFEECCALCLWARTQARARCCLQLRGQACMRMYADSLFITSSGPQRYQPAKKKKLRTRLNLRYWFAQCFATACGWSSSVAWLP